MKLEILLATMNQPDDSLLDTMGVASDILVCNQNPETTGYRGYERKGRRVRWYDFQEKGVGLNRNNALFRATGDICILADDDITYFEDYEETILRAFRERPEADMILFNIVSPEGAHRYVTPKEIRVGLHNCGKFGAVRIAFRRMSVIKNAVCFNQLFGGGAMFSCGEDNMFIRDCIRKGLKVVALPDYILKLNEDRPSTWFEGYNEKFFEDLGSSFCFHFRGLAVPCLMLQLLRRRDILLTEYTYGQALAMVLAGVRKYRALR